MSRPRSVAVLGAGPCGLAATKVLLEHGLDVTTYEAGDRVGGQWVLGNVSGTSSAYRSLRTNTHKGMSRFSDFGFPEDWPDFPSHAQMAEWFESYARHFGFLERIRLGARVVRAEPDGDARKGWRVETEAGDTDTFDALVVATGSLWDPVTPAWPGEFSGTRIHAKDYLAPDEPAACRGRDVLVVGLGNTACELAVELAEAGAARRVLLSARSGQYILPRRVRGKLAAIPHPADPIPGWMGWLSLELQARLFRALFPRILKRMTRDLPTPESVGLPPRPDPFAKRVVINDEVVGRIASGHIEVRPAIERFEGSDVIFADGTRDAVDVVIAATGYRFTTPYLPPGVLGAAGNELSLYRGVMHPEHPSLFVVGVMQALCSIWPRAEQQARWIAGRLTDRIPLPPPDLVAREAYPVLRVPFDHCQLHTARLQRDWR